MAFGPLALQPNEFWNLTPLEFCRMVSGSADRQRQRLQEIWLGAALERQKKLPSLQKFVGGKKTKDKKPVSKEEIEVRRERFKVDAERLEAELRERKARKQKQ